MNTKQETSSFTLPSFSTPTRAQYQAAVSATQQAKIAIRAARLRSSVGALPSRLYAVNRGVPLRLYRLSCQLEAAKRAGL